MGTHSRSLALSLSLLLAIASAPLGAGEGNDVLEMASEEYPIPHHGVLTLDVPVPWEAVFYQPPYNQFPSITFSPLKSKSFQLFVTVFWKLFRNNESYRQHGCLCRLVGSALRDAVPALRKSLIALAYKPQVS